MNNVNLLLLITTLLLVGCKKKYEDEFKYKIVNNKICAEKGSLINRETKINWLFPEIRNSSGNVISGSLDIQKESHGYLFCSDLNAVKIASGSGIIQSDISIELDNRSSVQEYNLRNYSCIFSDKVELNLSKEDALDKCG